MVRLLHTWTLVGSIALAWTTSVFADDQTPDSPQPAATAAAPAPVQPIPPTLNRQVWQCPWMTTGLGLGAGQNCPRWGAGRSAGWGQGAGYCGGRGWGAGRGRGFGCGRYFVDQDGDGICDNRQALPAPAQ